MVRFLAELGADLEIENARRQTSLAVVDRGRTGNTEAAPATAELLRALGAGEPNRGGRRLP